MKRLNWSAVTFDLREGFGYHSYQYMTALAREGRYLPNPILAEQIEWATEVQHFAHIDLTLPMWFVGRVTNANFNRVPGRVWLNTMFESTVLPEGWKAQIESSVAHIVVPSYWLKGVFEDLNTGVPIHVVPEGVDPKNFEPLCYHYENDRPYTFMCLGDRNHRKGEDLTWRAFYKAFGDSKDVRLIVKARAHNLDKLREGGSRPSTINIFRYDAYHMRDVYAHADCFVFPSRGEGYGLPPREAAAMGIPTIIPFAHSFMDTGLNWGIVVERTERKKHPYEAGDWWDTDVDELAEKMRWCYENRDAAKERAMTGRQWLIENETWDHAATKIADLLDERL